MKKTIIGLAAVAAMGLSAFFFSGFKTPEILSENVCALSEIYCVSDPGKHCHLSWSDGDSWDSDDFSRQGTPETSFLEDLQKIL